MIPNKITKEAAVLRTRLKQGSINFIELENFFALVEQEAAAPVVKKKRIDRFAQQMENLERGRAIKPRY